MMDTAEHIVNYMRMKCPDTNDYHVSVGYTENESGFRWTFYPHIGEHHAYLRSLDETFEWINKIARKKKLLFRKFEI